MLDTKINTKVKTTNFEADDAITRHLEKRVKAIERLLDLSDTSVMCDIELARTTLHHQQGDIFRAEFNLHTARGDFYAAAEKETIVTAIDEAKNELRKALRRQKGKRLDNIRQSGARLKDFIRGWRRK